MYSRLKTLALVLAVSLHADILFAASYPLPTEQQSLIGEVDFITTAENEDVISIAKKYNIGFNAIKSANPGYDFSKTFFPGTVLTIPTQHLIPNTKREGIVINLPEMRMYYFPRNSQEIFTYPIGIGKIGNTIPIQNATIVRKAENPVWIPTENIRKFNEEQGIILPKVMGAGPENPLGKYAIYTSLKTYLIHSTIFPESVGKRASFGCIRMFESDIETFFPSIQKDVPIYILNHPIKIAIQDNKLYMESHTPMEEHRHDQNASLPFVVHEINELIKNRPFVVDWQLVADLTREKDGMPHEVGFAI